MRRNRIGDMETSVILGALGSILILVALGSR
jgi:hypothetical protein